LKYLDAAALACGLLVVRLTRVRTGKLVKPLFTRISSIVLYSHNRKGKGDKQMESVVCLSIAALSLKYFSGQCRASLEAHF
jgi:hypothetical protein